MNVVRVGAVGLGRLGLVHAQNVARKIPGAQLVAACAKNPRTKEWGLEQLGTDKLYTDFKQMLDEVEMDAVIINSPSPDHCWMIEYALGKGLHVFTEKPLGCTLEECKRAEKAVEAHPDQIFFLGFMRRYDPSYADAKEKIESGKYGIPYLVKATSLDPESVIEGCIKYSATSGGVFIDASSHDIDLMRWYLGGEVVEVDAAGTNFKHKEFEQFNDTESGIAMLKFDNGKLGLLHVGRTAPHGYHTETEIVCTDAQLRVSGIPWKNRLAIFDSTGAVQPIIEDFPQRFEEAYLLEMKEFIDCIRENRKPGLTVYDGTKATVVAYAITESFRTGKPVKIEY